MEKLRTQDVLEESNGSASEDSVLAVSNGWADVRDLADAHVTALEKEEVAGERIQVVEASFNIINYRHFDTDY
ncbi:hypothetical protein BDQ17DRAFT_617785 [Cyathus striatus]|nr:hypothetical protein BDQ17DRAFT_617785 [Cyathus striatus]